MKTRTIYKEVVGAGAATKLTKTRRASIERDIVAQASTGSGAGLGNSGYQGAWWTPNRGYLYWPNLDPSLEVDTYSRVEIARKTHWFCGNVGLAQRVIECLTNLIVGTGLNPHATTSDGKWNALSEARYKARGRSPIAYSVNGRLGQLGMQRLAVKTDLKDGDAAIVFAKSEAGGPLRAIYSGLQIANATKPGLDQSKWKDGIFYDSLDRAQFYRFPAFSDQSTFTDVAAQNVRFICRQEVPGQRRGMGVLHRAANKLQDREQISAHLTRGIIESTQLGYYITSDTEEKRRGANANVGRDRRGTRQVELGNGQKVTVKMVYGSGGEIVSLPKGCDLKTLLDQRPHPNVAEFDEKIIRDIAWGAGVSSDLLWNICKLGGANIRYILADAQVFLQTEQQRLIDQWLAADYVWSTALDMKLGLLPPCEDPEWWKHGWVPPARMTVDYGRDGRILLDWHRYGLLGTERFFSMQGLAAREELGKELDLWKWFKDGMAERQLSAEDLRPFEPRRPVALQPGEEVNTEIVPTASGKSEDDEEEDDSGGVE